MNSDFNLLYAETTYILYNSSTMKAVQWRHTAIKPFQFTNLLNIC